MTIDQMREAFRFVRRWNVERGYWSRADAQAFEAEIGEAVKAGDKDRIGLFAVWLSAERRQVDALIAMLEPLCRAMEERVKTEMRKARKVEIG